MPAAEHGKRREASLRFPRRNRAPAKTFLNEVMSEMTNEYFPVKTPARFLWQQTDGSWREARGTTRDISRFGVFLSTDTVPSPGTQIQVIVNLPASDRRDLNGQLYGKGVTVRSEDEGFAAEILFQSGWASALLQLGREDPRPYNSAPAPEPWIPSVNPAAFNQQAAL